MMLRYDFDKSDNEPLDGNTPPILQDASSSGTNGRMDAGNSGTGGAGGFAGMDSGFAGSSGSNGVDGAAGSITDDTGPGDEDAG